MTEEEIDPKAVGWVLKYTPKEVEKILKELEDIGVVWKRWDVKKDDYIWYKTELGHDVAKKMGIE